MIYILNITFGLYCNYCKLCVEQYVTQFGQGFEPETLMYAHFPEVNSKVVLIVTLTYVGHYNY